MRILNKEDKEDIRKIIQEELKASLVRTVTVEYGPRKQGDPEKVIKTEEWNVLDWFAVYAPKIEAALRGLQADVDRTVNSVDRQDFKIDTIGQVLLSMEQSAKTIAMLSDNIRNSSLGLIENKQILIEKKD